MATHPIGIFDSGYGGLTVFKAINERLPQYDYIYLGDNSRAPYGNRSFETVYEYTLQSVKWLFDKGCPLVILACNTASAKALRNIQQEYLPRHAPEKRVLGVIRPTAEIIGNFSKTRNVGVLGTNGTISSRSYEIEINHFFPDVTVFQQACPMWVPIVESGDLHSDGTEYYVKKYLDELQIEARSIDTVLLGCTHYPLLVDTILKFLPPGVKVVTQGDIVAASLEDYLVRHPEIDGVLTTGGESKYFTTDGSNDFDRHASMYRGMAVVSEHVVL